KIPEFMEPLTDLSVIAQPLARWKRALEIEKWNQMFAQHPPSNRLASETKELDLRLVIDDEIARLQWQRPGRAEFETLKQSQFRQLDSDYTAGLIKLNPEAELLWQLFSNALDYGCK